MAAASPRVRVADVDFNISQICSFFDEALSREVSLLAFPELCVTGYTCADLFGQHLLLEAAEAGVKRLLEHSRGSRMVAVVGAPVPFRGRLYNCALVVRNGCLLGIIPKIAIPTYNEFYEGRWFSSGADFLFRENVADAPMSDNAKVHFREGLSGVISYAGTKTNISPNQLFRVGEATFAVEVCEDVWGPVPPSSYYALAGAEILVNLSASNDLLNKHEYRKQMVSNLSGRTNSCYVYCSCGFGESTQDLVFAGSSLIYENGSLLAENERFSTEGGLIEADADLEKIRAMRQKQSSFEAVSPDGTHSSHYARYFSLSELGPCVETDFERRLLRHVEAHPFVPGGDGSEIDRRAREITSIQVLGLATRLSHIGCRKAVLGISGGLDSTLALLVTVLAFDKLGIPRSGIIAITMPGFGTTDRTHDNAVELMQALGVTCREISIVSAVSGHFRDIGQDASLHDVTYENSQARERTQILMDLANKENAIVVGTGDLSELALGWATYNGDHMSMYAVNASVPKTLVKYLVRWAADNHRFDGAATVCGDSSGELGAICGGSCEVTGTGEGIGIGAGAGIEPCTGRRTVREILTDIIDTPISPELIPADGEGRISQKTEDLVGPYELHDFFLYNFFRFGYSPEKLFFLARKAFCGRVPESSIYDGKGTYDEETIRHWLSVFCRRFFSQQFKRSCMPDGPKVGTVSLSPRGDLRMPSDASSTLWTGSLGDVR